MNRKIKGHLISNINHATMTFLEAYLNDSGVTISLVGEEGKYRLYPFSSIALLEFEYLESEVRPGVFKRPSAEELAARKEPEAIKGGKEAMKETLDKINKNEQ